MAQETTIQWCDSTVNPTTKDNPRPGRMNAAANWSDLTRKFHRQRRSWQHDLPRMILIGDMADNFSSEIEFEYLWDEVIFHVDSEKGRRHRWQWLTERPERMAEFSAWLAAQGISWPVNLWSGTSVSMASELSRITDLAGVGDDRTLRFVWVEPQRESISLGNHLDGLDWVIQGGKSEMDEHPFDISWAAALQAECREARVPYFLRQLGQHVTDGGQQVTLEDGHGGDELEWPEELCVRQMPIFASRPPDNTGVRRRDMDA